MYHCIKLHVNVLNIMMLSLMLTTNILNPGRQNREYLAPQIRSMNNQFHLEAKLPWSYDYSLANDFATNKSSANREIPLFSHLYPSFGCLWKIFTPKGLKYSLVFIKDPKIFVVNCSWWQQGTFCWPSVTINTTSTQYYPSVHHRYFWPQYQPNTTLGLASI